MANAVRRPNLIFFTLHYITIVWSMPVYSSAFTHTHTLCAGMDVVAPCVERHLSYEQIQTAALLQ